MIVVLAVLALGSGVGIKYWLNKKEGPKETQIRKISENEIIEISAEKAEKIIESFEPVDGYPILNEQVGNRIYFQTWDQEEGGCYGKDANPKGLKYIGWFGYQDLSNAKVYRFNFIQPFIDDCYEIEPGIGFRGSNDGRNFAWFFRTYKPDKTILGFADLTEKKLYLTREYEKRVFVDEWIDTENIRVSDNYNKPPYYKLNVISGESALIP